MFTGIVTDLGHVRSISETGDTRIVIATAYDTSAIPVGASICCSGVCLTVVEVGADSFAVDASSETLSRTTLGSWKVGSPVNLERALCVGDELGGHLVSGHVDGVGSVVSIREEGASHRFEFEAPRDLMRFIAPKGSVAVDGVSLTVNEVDAQRFGVNIIEHTWTVTTFGSRHPGDPVNLEIDLIARYVARLLDRD